LSITARGDGLIVYPTGLGATKRVALNGFRVQRAFFHPNGKEILLFASESGHGSRIYRMNLAGGAPRPISAEGVTDLRVCAPSPDGRYIPGFSVSDGKFWLYPLEGGEPREIAGLAPKERLSGWVAGAKALFVYVVGELPARVYRVDFESGKRELVREIAPADRAGVSGSFTIRFTPDAQAYAYNAVQMLHELNLVEGLK
jgi:hypothetical protein